MKILALAFCVTIASASIAGAENRYSLAETDSGTVRLDRKTGTVSFCRKVGAGLACSMAAEEREAMEKAHEDMAIRIDTLEERLAKLELAILEAEQEREKSSAIKKPDKDKSDQLSGDEERQIDKAMRVTENVMRRFIGAIKDIKRDLETN